MEKTVTVDGKPIRFKTSGAALLIYNAQTGRDFLSDIMSMHDEETGKLNIKGFDTVALLHICWVLARIADPTIPEPMTWLDRFDAFPVADVFSELSDLMINCISTNVKVKNAVATANLSQKKSGKKRSKHR